MHLKSHAKKPNSEKDYPWIIFLSVVVVVVGRPLSATTALQCALCGQLHVKAGGALRVERSARSASQGALRGERSAPSAPR